jgi:tetratricopeptide (TPR) repeat protein
MEAETRKGIVARRIGATSDAPPRLLRDSRATAAALALLEKGIKLIYQRDLRKARAELKSLIETHPEESEIVARARSYIQICNREEAAHKKPAITNDQLYTLGVMEHNRGNYDEAISHFHQSLEKHPKADYILYSLAASLAMKGSALEAIQSLRKAIALSEDNRIYAKNDADFASLQRNKEFADLVGMSPATNHESRQ